MVTKIQKFIDALNKKDRKLIKELVAKILVGNLKNLDLKKLTGHSNIYRVRKGEIRIVFSKDNKEEVFILKIERRNDTTYKDF